MGPDSMHSRILKELADVVAQLFSIRSEKLWLSDTVLSDWKKRNITLIYKKGRKEDLRSCKLVSVTSLPWADPPG